jgi:hypothetical protein
VRDDARATTPDTRAVGVLRALLGPARAETWGTFAAARPVRGDVLENAP